MSNDNQQLLSALVDNELDRFSGRRASNLLVDDEQARLCWARYHAISAVMQEDAPVLASHDFAAAVSNALVEEEAHHVTHGSHWLKPAMGAAIAASVAVLSIVSFRAVVVDDPVGAELVASSSAPIARSASPLVLPVSSSVNAGALPMNDEDLNRYLLRHASTEDAATMLPRVRVVAHQTPNRP